MACTAAAAAAAAVPAADRETRPASCKLQASHDCNAAAAAIAVSALPGPAVGAVSEQPVRLDRVTGHEPPSVEGAEELCFRVIQYDLPV